MSEAMRAVPEEPTQVVPCCGYQYEDDNYPVYWNQYNGAVQCHNCGHTWSPAAAPAPVDGLAARLLDYADHPTANGFAPISPATLREAAAALQSRDEGANAQGEAVAWIVDHQDADFGDMRIRFIKLASNSTLKTGDNLYAHPPMPDSLPDEPDCITWTRQKMADERLWGKLVERDYETIAYIDALRAHCLKEPK